MWVAANSRIMHKLVTIGKLSGTSSVADYLSYTVKFAELLEQHTLSSVVLYRNEYRKLQHKYGFRWRSDFQHLHTRFLIKRQPTGSSASTQFKLSEDMGRGAEWNSLNIIFTQWKNELSLLTLWPALPINLPIMLGWSLLPGFRGMKISVFNFSSPTFSPEFVL